MFTVWRVCGHCQSSSALASGVDLLVCTLSLMPWQCPECTRCVSYVIKPDTDADTN